MKWTKEKNKKCEVGMCNKESGIETWRQMDESYRKKEDSAGRGDEEEAVKPDEVVKGSDWSSFGLVTGARKRLLKELRC